MAKLRTPSQLRFRTVLRNGAAHEPDFAGHYVLVEWGCGTGCLQFALVDRQSGNIYNGPFGDLREVFFCLGANVEDDKTGIFYHPDSALLILRGCPNSKGCATYYYFWTGSTFKLLRQTPAETPFGCEP
jgi:hypothetical protein